MSDRITLDLFGLIAGHAELLRAWAWAKPYLHEGKRLVLELRIDTRTLKQNKTMWSCLTDLSRQVTWFGKRLTPKGWKDFITGHLNGQELHPNMDGTGFISITKGESTSDMTIREMIAVIDLCHAFGADQGVKWSKTSIPGDADKRIDQETGEVLEGA